MPYHLATKHNLKSSLVFLLLSTFGCVYMGAQDDVVELAHHIEDKRDALQFAKDPSGRVTHRFMTRAPWILLFVPKTGLDEASARTVNIREEDLADIRSRMTSWSGSAVLIHLVPGVRTITRLAEGLDVERQISLHGNTGEVALTVALVTKGGATVISSVTAQ